MRALIFAAMAAAFLIGCGDMERRIDPCDGHFCMMMPMTFPTIPAMDDPFLDTGPDLIAPSPPFWTLFMGDAPHLIFPAEPGSAEASDAPLPPLEDVVDAAFEIDLIEWIEGQ